MYRDAGASFITLTYNARSVPVSSQGAFTLCKSDFQRFLKRLRKCAVSSGYNIPLRYLACGEYGETSALPRPHYHICLLGACQSVADMLVRKSWDKSKYGLIDVKPLALSAVGYVCKYLSDTHPFGRVLQEYQQLQCEPPFFLSSKRLGCQWIEHHVDEIVSSGFRYRDVLTGEYRLYPRKVRSYVEALTGVDYRPYVKEYMSTIDTHGMSLDDYNCFRDYNNARNSYIKSIQSGKAAYQLSHCRLPRIMRSVHDDDYCNLAAEADK